jgi:hypothetical protein
LVGNSNNGRTDYLVGVQEHLELDRRDVTVPAGVFKPIGALGYDEEAEWKYQRLYLGPTIL